MRVAIITGVDEEAEAFLPGQYERVEQHGHLSVRFVTHRAHAVAISCCGVGKVNAANTNKRVGVKGPKDNTDPHLAREAAHLHAVGVLSDRVRPE